MMFSTVPMTGVAAPLAGRIDLRPAALRSGQPSH
jgi:hypothetical protein